VVLKHARQDTGGGQGVQVLLVGGCGHRAGDREPGGVDVQRGDHLQVAADPTPVTGQGCRAHLPDGIVARLRGQGTGHPDAVLVLACAHIRAGVAGPVVVLAGGPETQVRGSVPPAVRQAAYGDPGAVVHGHLTGVEVGVRGERLRGLHALVADADMAGVPDGDVAVDAAVVADVQRRRAGQVRVVEPLL